MAGALGDFLAESSGKFNDTELEFEAVPLATSEGCLNALKNGDIDVAAPIHLSPSDAENLGLVSTDSQIGRAHD